jgi:hypothetical protein
VLQVSASTYPNDNPYVNTHLRQTARIAVLDTQSVLDWWHFQDPRCADWEPLRLLGRWHWHATSRLRDELVHVLGRGQLGAGAGLGPDAVLAAYEQRVTWGPAPAEPPLPALRCRDTDDQKFIDFALTIGARWLVSRDKAVLHLARRASALHGLQIVHPQDWRPQED